MTTNYQNRPANRRPPISWAAFMESRSIMILAARTATRRGEHRLGASRLLALGCPVATRGNLLLPARILDSAALLAGDGQPNYASSSDGKDVESSSGLAERLLAQRAEKTSSEGCAGRSNRRT